MGLGAQELERLFGMLVIQVRRRFIGDEQLGLIDDRARNGEALGLAVGQLGGLRFA